MIWALLYAIGVMVLVVRVRTPDAPPPAPLRVPPGEPLWLTKLHHGLFLALLAGAPLEGLLVSGAAGGRALGAALFAAGVALYRVAGRTLGEALTPFVEPRPGAALVTRGPYRWLRHPMYLSEALLAVGAPLTLGSRHVVWLALPALLVLAIRIRREDEALARTFPEYAGYAARTRRIVPFLF